MTRNMLLPIVAIAALLGATGGANASTMMKSGMMKSNLMMKSGPDHGMPVGLMGGDGVTYKGAPDLQAAISLVTAGGAPGHFSLVRALTALAGSKVAGAEVAKLTRQYGAKRVTSFVTIQNFAVNDAVRIATNAGVKFPAPMLHGAILAKRVVGLGLVHGTYYEGVQLDHLVTNKIHEAVMNDIDAKYGMTADANYHLIANQAHYDLAQALGVTSVKLARFH
ncbi:MAG: hypothetical protein M3R30_09115 [Candidatus Eremiobacteraeota bacterium]|nr:hypothetical protein [Candidatus Eremiobacteraeota bacterium]